MYRFKRVESFNGLQQLFIKGEMRDPAYRDRFARVQVALHFRRLSVASVVGWCEHLR